MTREKTEQALLSKNIRKYNVKNKMGSPSNAFSHFLLTQDGTIDGKEEAKWTFPFDYHIDLFDQWWACKAKIYLLVFSLFSRWNWLSKGKTDLILHSKWKKEETKRWSIFISALILLCLFLLLLLLLLLFSLLFFKRQNSNEYCSKHEFVSWLNIERKTSLFLLYVIADWNEISTLMSADLQQCFLLRHAHVWS